MVRRLPNSLVKRSRCETPKRCFTEPSSTRWTCVQGDMVPSPQPVRGSRPDRNQPCLVVVRAKAVGDSPLQQRLADVHSHYDTGRQLLREGRAPQAAIRQLEYCVLRDVLFAPAYERMAEAYDLIGLPGKEEELREQARFAHQKNWERKVEAELQSQSQRDPVGADITPAGMRFRSVV